MVKISIELPKSSAEEFIHTLKADTPESRFLAQLGVTDLSIDAGGMPQTVSDRRWQAVERLERVSRIALHHVMAAFEQHDTTGDRSIERSLLESLSRRIEARGVRRSMAVECLVRTICHSLGYEVHFFPWKGADFPQGFVSWLIVDFSKNWLTIVYDSGRVQQLRDSDSEREKILAKILLKECGHAALHLDALRAMRESPGLVPGLTPEQEQEAWLYAHVVWGVLVGEHSRSTRADAGYDGGLEIA